MVDELTCAYMFGDKVVILLSMNICIELSRMFMHYMTDGDGC